MSQEASLHRKSTCKPCGVGVVYLVGLLGLQRSYSRLRALLHELFAFV